MNKIIEFSVKNEFSIMNRRRVPNNNHLDFAIPIQISVYVTVKHTLYIFCIFWGGGGGKSPKVLLRPVSMMINAF